MYASEGGVRASDDGELDMRAELVNRERKAPGSQPGTDATDARGVDGATSIESGGAWP